MSQTRVSGSHPGEYGECIVTRFDDPVEGVQLRIDRADPCVLIAKQLLDELRSNSPSWPATFDGEVFRIRGVNQTVVYRIRRGGPGLYIGEFPD